MSPLLSVLIVNHNGRRFLPDCLDALRSRVSCPHEVIVVDNASTDGSAEWLASACPWVRLLVSRENLGFTAGNNLAARHAGGESLLLLNTDTVLLDDPAPALALLEREADVGVVGAKMLSAEGIYRPSAGHFPAPARLIRIRSMYLSHGPFRDGDFPPRPESWDCDWIEGSFLLTRRELWQRLGGLDERFFMYGEDVDYCRRALGAGFRTVFCPAISYVHFGGFSVERMAWTVDGFRRFHLEHSGLAQRWLAEGVLSTGLVARSLLAGLRWIVTRDPEQRIRMRTCWTALFAARPRRSRR